ncbi:carbohydrate ABC transporter permease [Occultella aeris]|uniref:Lactose transport system permease protein LacF n=1 Tax=Occultella aeris TaxID=2761496 RepID=A0A7M4DHZ6_9MICO|nr:sugar ABC transporter permease [Occultella aeris]VZO36543.1 Lactose transport system permease protein LacF [Occultella aeris]
MRDVLGDRKAIVILLAPALAFYTLIKLVPILWSLGLTFFDGNVLRGYEPVGFGNFTRLVGDSVFWEATAFTLKYALVATGLQVAAGYLLAILYVFVLRKGSALLRTIVFFPVILPTVAVGVLFKRLFGIHPTPGPVNSIIEAFGGQSLDWFASGDTSFLVLILMDVWRSMGFFAVLLFAGLVDIPEEVIESARMDGAKGARLIRHIVLPLSLPVLLSAVVFAVNSTLKVFDSILAITNGGPGTETQPLTLYMYRTVFTYNEYGYGSTLALALTVIAFLVTIVIFRSARKDITADKAAR